MSTMRSQQGSMIIEALIALVLFSFGILGLIGLQAAAINTNVDTGYRVEANNFANRIFTEMQSRIRRDTGTNYLNDIQSFDHLSTGDACDFSGTSAHDTNPVVGLWLDDLQAATGLPRASGQIRTTVPSLADARNGAVSTVRIVVCWHQPGLPVPRRHVLMGNIT